MSNIDEKAKNNFIIEMRIFENYEKVKHEIIKVIDFLRHAETNMGMCRIFDNQNHEFWHSVIKPWFQPERFGITYLWFSSGFSFIGYGEYHIIRGNRWMKTPIDKIDRLRDDANKRILKCQEGKNIWYRLWINPEDMMRIEPLLEGGDRIWMEELEMYYTLFYEIRNGRRLIGKNRVKKILDTLL